MNEPVLAREAICRDADKAAQRFIESGAEQPNPPRKHHLEQIRFGRLVALRHVGNSRWECVCDCGTMRTIASHSLLNGRTRSCGCLNAEKRLERSTRHGGCGTKTYYIWAGMRDRCSNENNSNFAYYGGVGVSVCERWHDFANFRSDMGECPPGHSIDRIDPCGNYEPSNCRWLPMEMQAATKRSVKRKRDATPEILRLHAAGLHGREIARKVGVSPASVWRVLQEHRGDPQAGDSRLCDYYRDPLAEGGC